MTISALIDKQDTFEVVRDQIGAILLAEVASQKSLAVSAAQDPRLYDLRVFTERSNPWAEYLQAPEQLDGIPIINVYFDNMSVQENAANVVERQTYNANYNLDCYGYGISAYAATGHVAGDAKAHLEATRATKLVRNILMAGEYTYLGLRGVVGRRMVQSIESFRPPLDEKAAIQIAANRISFSVRFNEFSPQVPGEIVELVHVDVRRKETGELYLSAEYDVT